MASLPWPSPLMMSGRGGTGTGTGTGTGSGRGRGTRFFLSSNSKSKSIYIYPELGRNPLLRTSISSTSLPSCLLRQQRCDARAAAASHDEPDETMKMMMVDWVNRHVRDPRVEVDPVTVLRRISKTEEQQHTTNMLTKAAAAAAAAAVQQEEEQASSTLTPMPLLVKSTTAPAPLPISMIGLRNNRWPFNLGGFPSLTSALFLLAIAAAASLYFFMLGRRSKGKSLKQEPLFSSSVKRKLVDKSLRISASIQSAMNIGAASVRVRNLNTTSQHALPNHDTPCSTDTNIEEPNLTVVSKLDDIQDIKGPANTSSIVEDVHVHGVRGGISVMSQEVSVDSGMLRRNIGHTHDHGYQLQNEAAVQNVVTQSGLLTECMPLPYKSIGNMINGSVLDSLWQERIDNRYDSQDQQLARTDRFMVTIGEPGDHGFTSTPGFLDFSCDAFNGVIDKFEETKSSQDAPNASQSEQQDSDLTIGDLSNCKENGRDASSSEETDQHVVALASEDFNNSRVIGQPEEMQHHNVPSLSESVAMPGKENLPGSTGETVKQASEIKQSYNDMSLSSPLPGTKKPTTTPDTVPCSMIQTDVQMSDKVSKLGNLRALAAIVPIFTVGVGSMGLLLGGGSEGLEIVGLTVLTSVLCQDLLWAQSRESLKHELSSITDRKKLRKFLERRNVIIQERMKNLK